MTPLTTAPQTGIPKFNIPTGVATALTTPYGEAPGVVTITNDFTREKQEVPVKNTVIKVRYSGSESQYTYLYNLKEEVKVGDFVVVRARNILSLAKVVVVGNAELLDPTATFKYLSVIDRVDLSRDTK